MLGTTLRLQWTPSNLCRELDRVLVRNVKARKSRRMLCTTYTPKIGFSCGPTRAVSAGLEVQA